MRSPASAIAWEFRQRHRVAAFIFFSYAVALAIFWIFFIGPSHPLRLYPPNGLGATIVAPLTTAFMYLLAVFSFGLDGDIAARASIYPRRFFTLPVTTEALAGWPMFLGGVTVAALWVGAVLIGRWAWGLDLPLVWPAALAAVFLAWTQVLTWSAYPIAGLRIVATVLWLVALDAEVILAVESKFSEAQLLALLLPQLPLAYFAARFVVGRARRGLVPDWSGAFMRARGIVRPPSRQAQTFDSPGRAQLWFEWRQDGWVLPLSVLMVLPFELALLYVCRHERPVVTFETLLFTLLTPPFLAGFAGAMGSSRSGTFSATRPLTSRDLVAVKFKSAIASTLMTWLPVFVSLPAALAVSGSWPMVKGWLIEAIDIAGLPRAIVLAFLIVAGLLISTWKQLVQSQYIRLTGSDSLVRASVVIRLSMLIVLFPLIDRFFRNPRVFAAVWESGPWILAALVAIKIVAASRILSRLHRTSLFTDHALLKGASTWLVLVLTLYGVLVWLIATPPVVPRYVPMLIAILSAPLARISAAPLALAWSRHGGATRKPDGSVPHSTSWAIALSRVLILVPAAVFVFEAASFEISTRSNGTLLTSGQEREYLLYVPKTYDRARPTPLVISMHGAALWPTAQRDVSRWNSLAEREGFLVVYPSGIAGRGPRAWHTNLESGDREVRFIADLIDKLKMEYNLDPRRIYADGLSNGGGMAFVLSCALSDRIAAVGLVASAQFVSVGGCPDAPPVPVIAFHGTADRAAPYGGGRSWVGPTEFANIPKFTAQWAARNRCDASPSETAVAHDVVRREYPACADNAEVVLYIVKEGGHSWPGGGPLPRWAGGSMTRSIDATSLMWAFYRAHPRRS